MAENLNTSRAIEAPVIVHPPTYHGIHESGKILQTLVVSCGGHPPFADGCTNRGGSLGAHRRKKAHKELSPVILRSSRLEGVTQEVELDRSRRPRSIIILAIHDASLGCIELKTALQEAITNGFQYLLGLSLTPAMDDGIIRITFELDLRELPLHPEIECIMQEEISQQRTRNSTLRRASCPLLQSAICFLHGSSKPPRNIQLHPWNVGMVCHSPLHQVMRNGIKICFDVQIDNPVSTPAALPRYPHRVKRRLPGAIAVGVRMELRFQQRLQHHLHHSLCNAISDSWNPEWALAPVILRYLNETHRWAESTSPTTSDSRSYKGYPSDPFRMPSATRHPPQQHLGLPLLVGTLPKRVVLELHMALLQTQAPPISG